MSIKLKPCPFCGSENIEFIKPYDDEPDLDDGFLLCHRCEFASDIFANEQMIADKWNQRAKEDTNHADT